MSSQAPEPGSVPTDGAPPQYAQPQSPPSQSLPPYAGATPEQRAIWEKRGTRAVGFGVAWLIGGLLITVYTYSQAAASEFGGVYVVAYGPMLYGAYRIISGALTLRKARN